MNDKKAPQTFQEFYEDCVINFFNNKYPKEIEAFALNINIIQLGLFYQLIIL